MEKFSRLLKSDKELTELKKIYEEKRLEEHPELKKSNIFSRTKRHWFFDESKNKKNRYFIGKVME